MASGDTVAWTVPAIKAVPECAELVARYETGRVIDVEHPGEAAKKYLRLDGE